MKRLWVDATVDFTACFLFMCVCVCVRARACACVRMCVCVRERELYRLLVLERGLEEHWPPNMENRTQRNKAAHCLKPYGVDYAD